MCNAVCLCIIAVISIYFTEIPHQRITVYIMPFSVRFCHTAVFSCSTLRLTCVPSKKSKLLPCFPNVRPFDGVVSGPQMNPVSVPCRLQVIRNSDVLGGACNDGEVTSEYVASRRSVALRHTLLYQIVTGRLPHHPAVWTTL